jgi:peptidoglycan/xylan/chitin deacetylase (PgdA/CDA1 family)
MFHHFHDARHPRGQGSISADDLARLVDDLRRDRILSPQEWTQRTLRGALRESDVCLTFDDSLRCQYDVAYPVMKTLGITAFWFVYTSVMEGAVERLELYRHYRHTCFASIDEFYLEFWRALQNSDYARGAEGGLVAYDPATYLVEFPFYSDADRRFRFVRDEVLGPDRYDALMDRMMVESGFDRSTAAANLWIDDEALRRLHRDGHAIGLHSHSHPTRMALLHPLRQEEEYRRNYHHLQNVLGETPTTMAHPCNSYNADTLTILRRLGIVVGFRSNMAPRAGASLLEYPREDHANLLKMQPADR